MDIKKALKIKSDYENGMSQVELAKKYKVSISTVRNVIYNQTGLMPTKETNGIEKTYRRGIKLTIDKANEIRERYKKENITQKELAKEYGVAKSTICHIIRLHMWY